MNYLALDYGAKRIGLAIAHQSTSICMPLNPLRRKSLNEDMLELLEIIGSREISIIVVGKPLNMDGTEGSAVKKVQQFLTKLRRRLDDKKWSHIDIFLFDERLSSYASEDLLKQQGKSLKKHRDKVDSLSAMLILEDYLESNSDTHST